MLKVNPDLRLLSIHSGAIGYLIGERKEFHLSEKAVSLLMDLKTSKGPSENNLLQASSNTVELSRLLNFRILVDYIAERPNQAHDASASVTFSDLNWNKAHDYLRNTFDYPFFNYAEDGWQRDAQMMSDYLANSPESPRSKFKSPKNEPQSFPNYEHAIAQLRTKGPRDFCQDVQNILIVSIGVKNWKPLSQGNPVLKKNVPSGGGRHPTEAYLFDFDSGSISSFCPIDSSFSFLRNFEIKGFYKSAFFEPNVYIKFKVRKAIVFTSMWERNMFRYRESRTFRSVHLDAGHRQGLLATSFI